MKVYRYCRKICAQQQCDADGSNLYGGRIDRSDHCPSSAAATYMLADLVEPDPDKFVALMNQKAKEIGMTHTTYYNCVGVTNDLLYPYAPKNLPADADNVTSPQDYALLCSYFVKTYPDILTHTSSPEIVVKEGTPYEEHFKSYQISLEGASMV